MAQFFATLEQDSHSICARSCATRASVHWLRASSRQRKGLNWIIWSNRVVELLQQWTAQAERLSKPSRLSQFENLWGNTQFCKTQIPRNQTWWSKLNIIALKNLMTSACIEHYTGCTTTLTRENHDKLENNSHTSITESSFFSTWKWLLLRVIVPFLYFGWT